MRSVEGGPRRLVTSNLDNLDLRKREDHLPPSFEEVALSLNDAVAEVPWQHEVVVRLRACSVALRDNGDSGPGREMPELVVIDFHDRPQVAIGYAAELECHVALCGGSIAEDGLAVLDQRRQEAGEVTAMTEHTLLEVPDAVGGEDLGDLAREPDRVVQVVEHRDRGDDAGWANPRLLVGSRRKELRHEDDVLRVVLTQLGADGVDADAANVACRVGLERGGVVAADVQHDVTGAEADQALQVAALPLQVTHHRLVETGPVAVVVPVQLV